MNKGFYGGYYFCKENQDGLTQTLLIILLYKLLCQLGFIEIVYVVKENQNESYFLDESF